MSTDEGKDWARTHNNILFFEASALEGKSVEEAFLEVAKKGVKRMESATVLTMPDSIGGAAGAIKLNPKLSSGDDMVSGGSRGATRQQNNC